MLQHQHPPHQQWNCVLSRNAEEGGIAVDTGNLAGNPAAARVIVIAVGIKEQEIFLDAVETQQHLGISVGNKAEHIPSPWVRTFHIGNYPQSHSSVSAHAINYEIG